LKSQIATSSSNWGGRRKCGGEITVSTTEDFPAVRQETACSVNILKRKIAESYPNRAIVQRFIAQLPWRTKLARMERF